MILAWASPFNKLYFVELIHMFIFISNYTDMMKISDVFLLIPTQDVQPMLACCWSSVVDVGPTITNPLNTVTTAFFAIP